MRVQALVAVLGALTHQVGGLPPTPAPPAAADATPSFGDTSTPARASSAASAAPTGDASALLGLKEPTGGRKVLTLDDVVADASAHAADIQIAAERVVQQEANLRRAWAAVLPQLNFNGAYTLTCSAGGSDVVDCGDRTTTLIDPAQLEQEATLFDSIASLLGVAAAASSDPAEKQKLLDQQAQLTTSSGAVRASAKDAKPLVVQPANVFTGSLSLSVPLFNGRAFPLLFNAVDAVDVSSRARDQVRSALVYSVMRGYHAAVAAKKLVAIAEQQADSAKRHSEATQARVDAGQQPVLALRRAELDELRASEQLENSRAAYDVAVAGIGLVLNKDELFDV
ncbi:MAG TPA: TolC family protein, partial [Myxococcota bacterium]